MRTHYRAIALFGIFVLTTACHTQPDNQFFPNTSSPFLFPSLSSASNDSAITNAILESMVNHENLSTVNIHVETMNGIVMLSGHVKTIRQSDTAEELAQKVPGVKSVRNNIVVRK